MSPAPEAALGGASYQLSLERMYELELGAAEADDVVVSRPTWPAEACRWRLDDGRSVEQRIEELIMKFNGCVYVKYVVSRLMRGDIYARTYIKPILGS